MFLNTTEVAVVSDPAAAHALFPRDPVSIGVMIGTGIAVGISVELIMKAATYGYNKVYDYYTEYKANHGEESQAKGIHKGKGKGTGKGTGKPKKLSMSDIEERGMEMATTLWADVTLGEVFRTDEMMPTVVATIDVVWDGLLDTMEHEGISIADLVDEIAVEEGVSSSQEDGSVSHDAQRGVQNLAAALVGSSFRRLSHQLREQLDSERTEEKGKRQVTPPRGVEHGSWLVPDHVKRPADTAGEGVLEWVIRKIAEVDADYPLLAHPPASKGLAGKAGLQKRRMLAMQQQPQM
jgi:hypothetical protein